jgi:hypothetical protein
VPDALDEVLRLVAEGRLTAEEAAPIIGALEAADAARETAADAAPRPDRGGRRSSSDSGSGSGGRTVRLEVKEDGRTVVNLRLPAGLGEAALLRIPGLAQAQVDRIRAAVAGGVRGTLLEAGNGDDGVRIVIE